MHWLYDKYLVTVIDRNNAVIQSTSPTGHHGVVDACAKCGQIIAGKSSRLRAISQSIVGQLIRVAKGVKSILSNIKITKRLRQPNAVCSGCRTINSET